MNGFIDHVSVSGDQGWVGGVGIGAVWVVLGWVWLRLWVAFWG